MIIWGKVDNNVHGGGSGDLLVLAESQLSQITEFSLEDGFPGGFDLFVNRQLLR